MVSVGVNVGLRHEYLESVVARLGNSYLDRGVPPTVFTSLDSLRHNRAHHAYEFETGADNSHVVDTLARDAERIAIPFIERHSSLEAVTRLLEAQRGPPGQTDYRLYVAYKLAGRDDDAQAYLDSRLVELGKRSDAVAVHFRQFAGNAGRSGTL